MEIWFTARRRFDPGFGPGWDEYIKWSGFSQTVEVCSLDTMLNPSMFLELIPQDWLHNIHEDFHTTYFRDLEYVEERMKNVREHANILAIIREPDAGLQFEDKGFAFCGYDLIGEGDVSALTNCGGFEKAFSGSDLSKLGLLDDYLLAKEVQAKLRLYYPDDHHANCDLWAIWRLDK
jgi:hypothetical protein